MKRQLDKFLVTILDEPQIHAYMAQRRAETKCLLDIFQTANALHRQEGGGTVHPSGRPSMVTQGLIPKPSQVSQVSISQVSTPP